SIFVVKPIGAIPQGRTSVVSRLKASAFIDSADATCERIQGKVNLLCRSVVIGQVAKHATVYLRLPYSQTLYWISTGGKRTTGERWCVGTKREIRRRTQKGFGPGTARNGPFQTVVKDRLLRVPRDRGEVRMIQRGRPVLPGGRGGPGRDKE